MSALPQVVRTADVQIGCIAIRVHHLSNGERVIDAESMEALFAALGDGTLLLSADDGMKIARAIHDD